MVTKPDGDWWDFSTDSLIRNDKAAARLRGAAGDGGGRPLDYHTYLNLGAILNAQAPTSAVPDERVFITVHQVYELLFKQMIFDAGVITNTLDALNRAEDGEFLRLALSRDKEGETFWRPASTAAQRIRLSGEQAVPLMMRFLGGGHGGETFSGIEFFYFRDNLVPASGFQSAQFRLLQRAFGKAALLSLRLFPGGAYGKRPGSSGDARMRVVDPRVLTEDEHVATPCGGSPLERVARVEEFACAVLARLSRVSVRDCEPPPVGLIEPEQVERALKVFASLLSEHRAGHSTAAGAAVSALREDLDAAARAENARRASLKEARRGAFLLRAASPSGFLTRVLDALVSADDGLYGLHEESFLSLHYEVAKRRIEEVTSHARNLGDMTALGGTGGGGIEYLGFVRKHLIPLFPALVCYRDVSDGACDNERGMHATSACR